jgi:hypothetical protein
MLCALLSGCGGADRVGSPAPAATTPPFGLLRSPPPAPGPTLAATTPAPSAPAGFARIFGKVVDDARRPIAGAEVAFEPFAVFARTDASGAFEVLVPVGAPGCAWTSIEVRVAGYGTYTRFDEPLSAGVIWWDPTIQPGELRQFVGAPLAYGSPVKPDLCPRGSWIAP